MMPDTLASWPWKRKINPHYHEVKAESSVWIQKFTTFAPHMQRTFDLGNFGNFCILAYLKVVSIVRSLALLASLAYPLESKGVLILWMSRHSPIMRQTSSGRVAISCTYIFSLMNILTLRRHTKLNIWLQSLWTLYAILTRQGQLASPLSEKLPDSKSECIHRFGISVICYSLDSGSCRRSSDARVHVVDLLRRLRNTLPQSLNKLKIVLRITSGPLMTIFSSAGKQLGHIRRLRFFDLSSISQMKSSMILSFVDLPLPALI